VKFDSNHKIDLKLWKPHNSISGVYVPRVSKELGKQLEEQFNKMIIVPMSDVNACIGFRSDKFRIGFAHNNKNFFGVIVPDNLGVQVPGDCSPVLENAFKIMFPKK
jgi:hypothetical protein